MNAIHQRHAGNYIMWFLLLFAALSPAAFAAEIQNLSLEDRVKQLEAARTTISSGDNAWMLASSALVLMMTAPGLILFYGGLVRRKNVLATMMHSLVLMAVMSVLWVVYGYSVAFAEGTPFFGNLSYFFLNGVGTQPN